MNMIAFCGIDCTQCETYRATLANDDSLRRETANRWTKDFGFDIAFSEINCCGCHSDIRFKLCDGCPFKSCCEEKGISNCGECDKYPCKTLERFLRSLPRAKLRLDLVHEQRYGSSDQER
ncbi:MULTISPECIES: DUF3795 domain-containing protein [unclassified Mesotoga]|uniref:DUF3795 domain-containing protein n=2 Tax=Mesotoga TaxID=1184396 RepID=UPI002877E8E6|nr:DUF3795 domain-containing protein [Mesotoga sp. BH458_6_3_2_1]